MEEEKVIRKRPLRVGRGFFEKFGEGRFIGAVPVPELNFRRDPIRSEVYDPNELARLDGDINEQGASPVVVYRLVGIEEKPDLKAVALKLDGGKGVTETLISVEDVDKLADVVKAIGKYVK